jgi:hypothetical protein
VIYSKLSVNTLFAPSKTVLKLTKVGTSIDWWAEGEGQGQNGVDWKGSADEANKAEKEVSGNGEYILIFEHRQETRDWELSGNALPF